MKKTLFGGWWSGRRLEMRLVSAGRYFTLGLSLAVVSSALFRTSAPESQLTFNSSHDGLFTQKRSSRHKRRPRVETENLRCGSYSRYSSDLQREESIADQQRECRKAAIPNGHTLQPEFEYSDEAVSGTVLSRTGLDAMREAAARGEFQVLYFHSLSRLARESVITMPMLKELVHVHHVRVISVTEGIDSSRDGWDLMATICSIQHERYVKDLSANVFRGQEGNVYNGYSNGDYCFGYKSVPVPGSETGRRGRNAKPRMVYAIDDQTAPWVLRIFHWFVVEKQSLRWIARKLNELGAPKDHRSSRPNWRHNQLPSLLRNAKYVGTWHWGVAKTVRNPLTGAKWPEERPEEERAQWTREMDHLRLISDEMREAALARLEENEKQHGRHRGEEGKFNSWRSGDGRLHPRHLLSQLVRCGHCERLFCVGGSRGKYLFCPGYHEGTCPCKTTLRRDRAEKMVLGVIGERVLKNREWRERVLLELRAAWQRLEDELPSELNALRTKLADIEARVASLLDKVENGVDSPALRKRLEEREEEQKAHLTRLQQLERISADRQQTEPTEEWLDAQFGQLEQTLTSGGRAAAHSLRALLGGEITVTEIREPGRERHYLVGRFTLPAANLINSLVPGTESDGSVVAVQEEVEVKFRDPEPGAQLADEVKRLYDQKLKFRDIAKQLNCGRPKVRRAFEYWHTARGLVPPDGRSLKKRLPSTRLAERKLDEIMELYRRDLSLGAIANQVGCDRNVVTEAVKVFFERQGLPAPDGRTRRKELGR